MRSPASAECWADSVPILLVSGQVNAATLDRECGNYHEIDLERIFQPATKWCGTVRRVEQIPRIRRQGVSGHDNRAPAAGGALPAARPDAMPPARTRSRPLDFQADAAVAAASRGDRTRPPSFSQPQTADHPGRRRRTLVRRGPSHRSSGRPAGCSGGHHAQRQGPARRAPSALARPRAIGPREAGLPSRRCDARRRLPLHRSDDRLAADDRARQLDPDRSRAGPDRHELSRFVVGIVADARSAVESISAALPPERPRDGWGSLWEEARAARPPRPEWLIDTLRAALPGDVPVFTDACEIGYRMQTDWISHGPRLFFYPSNYITLGWAFPGRRGCRGCTGRAAGRLVSGDGGFLMTAQELATAARYRLRVIAIVHNDSTYGAIKNIQDRNHDGRYLDVELNNPDFLAAGGCVRRSGPPRDHSRSSLSRRCAKPSIATARR